jgi:hypothetical protein
MQTNIKQFMRNFDASKKQILEINNKVFNSVLKEMYNRIVERTPVGNPMLWKYPAPKGYNPGTLKDSWRITLNGAEMSAGGLLLDVKGTDATATIYNPQPYAQRVEYGWSTQAPQGMLRLTVAEYSQILNDEASRYKI